MEIDLTIVLYLRLAVIIIDLVLFAVMSKKILKVELKTTKKYFTGAALFFLVHAICRTFYILYSYPFKDARIFYYVGTLLGLTSVVILVAAIEATLYTKSKHFFTIYGCVALAVMTIGIFVNFEYMGLTLMVWAQYLSVPILATFIILLYFITTIKSTGNVRRSAILMTVGIILFAVGEMGNTSTATTMIPWAYYAAPLLMIGGLILMYYSVSSYFKE